MKLAGSSVEIVTAPPRRKNSANVMLLHRRYSSPPAFSQRPRPANCSPVRVSSDPSFPSVSINPSSRLAAIPCPIRSTPISSIASRIFVRPANFPAAQPVESNSSDVHKLPKFLCRQPHLISPNPRTPQRVTAVIRTPRRLTTRIAASAPHCRTASKIQFSRNPRFANAPLLSVSRQIRFSCCCRRNSLPPKSSPRRTPTFCPKTVPPDPPNQRNIFRLATNDVTHLKLQKSRNNSVYSYRRRTSPLPQLHAVPSRQLARNRGGSILEIKCNSALGRKRSFV